MAEAQGSRKEAGGAVRAVRKIPNANSCGRPSHCRDQFVPFGEESN